MSRLFPILLALCCSCCVLVAQVDEEIDSLKHLLNASIHDSIKVNIYRDLCWAYLNPPKSDLDSGRYYADEVKRLGLSLDDQDQVALAEFYYGAIARFKGQHSLAIDHFQRFTSHFRSQSDSNRVAFGLFQLGNVYAQMGDYDMAIESLYGSLQIHESINDLSSMHYTLNTIGTVLKNAKRYQEAINTYERVLETDSLNADVLMNLGNVYADTDEFDMAKHYYFKALAIDRAAENQWAIAYDLENIGTLYFGRELLDSALLYFLRSYQIRENLPSPIEKSLSASRLAAVYTKQNKYNAAQKYLNEADSLLKGVASKSLKRDIELQKSNLAKARGNYRDALEYFVSHSQLKDSILNEESAQQINELQTQYETAKKDQQIGLLANEKELQAKETQRQATLKKAFIGGAILIAVVAGLLLFNLRQRLRNQKLLAAKDQEVKEANFQRQLSQLEMKALQAQINPHFIFNCLNSINQMILQGEDTNASRYLTKFSKLIRLILENAENSEVTLQDELAVLESYIELEQLRFQGNIDYQLKVDGNIDPEDTYLPSMVLQPFVENAIWHGLMPKKEHSSGKISIAARQKGDLLVCQIEDNGVGREKARQLQDKSVWKTKSMGLKITEERLSLLNQEYKQEMIRVTDLKDAAGEPLGTRVEVSIPT